MACDISRGTVAHLPPPPPPMQYGDEDSTRHVQQFHFLAWPDHGVPDYPTDILTFHQCVRTYHARCSNTGPMVVHCSAGVGRTGTFVTLDTCIQMMEAENKVDVFNFVRNLRWRRNYMVQTEVGGVGRKGVVVCTRFMWTAACPAPCPPHLCSPSLCSSTMPWLSSTAVGTLPSGPATSKRN